MHDVAESIITRFSAGQRTKILALGSSNTEHYLPSLHWFDCFEVSVRQKYGRVHTCINAGIAGDTSRGLLERFEEDATFYQPELVFITIGGNDAKPIKQINANQFRANLKELYSRFSKMGCGVVFQTYYAPDPSNCDPKRLENIFKYMDIVREIAQESNSLLIDHLARWEKLRLNYYEIYLKLMKNSLHVNERGNKVMGADIVRHFGIELDREYLDCWGEALVVQQIMDELEKY